MARPPGWAAWWVICACSRSTIRLVSLASAQPFPVGENYSCLVSLRKASRRQKSRAVSFLRTGCAPRLRVYLTLLCLSAVCQHKRFRPNSASWGQRASEGSRREKMISYLSWVQGQPLAKLQIGCSLESADLSRRLHSPPLLRCPWRVLPQLASFPSESVTPFSPPLPAVQLGPPDWLTRSPPRYLHL